MPYFGDPLLGRETTGETSSTGSTSSGTTTGGTSSSFTPAFTIYDPSPSASMTMAAETPAISVQVPPGEPVEMPVIPIVMGMAFGLFALMLMGFWIASRRRERKNEAARRKTQKPLSWPET
ncbi:hypothetical protein GQ53DRAFT_756505 [Thozetella sp. PMI_491]|nr:hypothetical protein GQ53DRAFT_756505 [Thozetella sp. PMI_491]